MEAGQALILSRVVSRLGCRSETPERGSPMFEVPVNWGPASELYTRPDFDRQLYTLSLTRPSDTLPASEVECEVSKKLGRTSEGL